MLEATAKSGRGTCNLIADGDHESVLNSKVIHALENSMDPALEGCTLQFGQGIQADLGTIFRN